MKKLALLFIIASTFGCHSQTKNDQSDIINLVGEQYLQKKVPKKIQEYGVAIKPLNDEKFLKSFFSTIEQNEKLKKKIASFDSKSVASIFSSDERANYVNQIDDIEFSGVEFRNKKLRSYESVAQEQKQYQYYHVSISKPVFTDDNKYAMVITTTSHLSFLNVLSKKDGKWNYLRQFSIFP